MTILIERLNFVLNKGVSIAMVTFEFIDIIAAI